MVEHDDGEGLVQYLKDSSYYTMVSEIGRQKGMSVHKSWCDQINSVSNVVVISVLIILSQCHHEK